MAVVRMFFTVGGDGDADDINKRLPALIHLVSFCLASRMFMSPLMLPTTSTTRMILVILCCASWTTLATLPCYYHNMVDDAFRNENVVKATPSLEDTRSL